MKTKFFTIWASVLVALAGVICPENCKAATTQEQHTPLAIIKKSGSETLRLFDLDGKPFGPTIDWEIDWPEGGEASIRNQIKATIIKLLSLDMPNGRTIATVTPKELFKETVKQRYKSEYGHIKTPAQYKNEIDERFWRDGEECKSTIEILNNTLVYITTTTTPNFMNGMPEIYYDNTFIRLDTGEEWEPKLLSSDSKLISLLASQWVKLGYPRNAVNNAGKELLDANSRYWTKEGLKFYYVKPYHLDIPDVEMEVEVTIPYRDLLPLLSSEDQKLINSSILN